MIYLKEQLLIKYGVMNHLVFNPKDGGYQRGLASMVYKLFDKKTMDGVVKNEIIQNIKLAEELHKAIIIKLKNGKYTIF